MEKELARQEAKAQAMLAMAVESDPEWAERTQAAWKRMVSAKPADPNAKEAFEKCLKEKGLLPEGRTH